MQSLFPPWLVPAGGLAYSPSTYRQEAVSIQDLLGEELKSEA